MGRPPNFSFERQERERQKARKAAEKAEAKRLSRMATDPTPQPSAEDEPPQ